MFIAHLGHLQTKTRTLLINNNLFSIYFQLSFSFSLTLFLFFFFLLILKFFIYLKLILVSYCGSIFSIGFYSCTKFFFLFILNYQIIIAISSKTGFFEWGAVQAFKLSKGKVWRLLAILCALTAILSAFLDNGMSCEISRNFDCEISPVFAAKFHPDGFRNLRAVR